MPLISILTAAHAPSARYLEATIAGVQDQVLPAGWELEWLIQEDGAEPRLADRLAGLSRVRYRANGGQLGVAATRNAALSRAAGDLVQLLDHDDVLLPGALATLISAFDTRSVHWAIGQADDLLPDGSRKEYQSALPYGLVPTGAVNAWALAHEGNWPIHCAGLMMRTASLHALGGWAGVPADDDTAMFAALSQITDGINDPAVTWLYRHHPDQAHRTATWRSRSTDGRRFALQRAAAIKVANLRFDLDAPLNGSQADVAAVHVGPAAKEQAGLHPL
jgi:glycosyltransferase involved in cell wall biosynthesis